jgi:hypothetical protein
MGARETASPPNRSFSADGRVLAFVLAANNLVRAPDGSDGGADLSGDGSLDDTLLAMLDSSSGIVTPLCPAEQVVVADERAAFLRPESAGKCAHEAVVGGRDLNGDGDTEDLVVHIVGPQHGVENLGLGATAIDLSGALLAAVITEDGPGEVRVFDLVSGQWAPTGQAADAIAVAGATVAFTTPEAAQVKTATRASPAGPTS